MSWKLKLKQKRFSLILLGLLLVSLAFNAYGYYSIYTQSHGLVNVQLSPNTEIRIQLDSETFMVVHAVADFKAYGYWLDTTDTTGDLEFETNGATVLNFYWLGNVSNVKYGRVDIGLGSIANDTDHSLADAHVYRLTWDWQGAFVVPPPSQFMTWWTAQEVNGSTMLSYVTYNGINFTQTVNSTYTTTFQTATNFYTDSNNIYTITFPEVADFNDTYRLRFLNITETWPDGTYTTTDTSLTFIPTNDMMFRAYYYLELYLLQPFLPVNFIIGIIGLASLVIGPTYGIMKLKAREIDVHLLYAMAITGLGLALTVSWLWHP